MFSKELEELIRITLLDGKLTPQERKVLETKAEQEGIDKDTLNVVLDARLHEIQTGKAPTPMPPSFVKPSVTPTPPPLPTSVPPPSSAYTPQEPPVTPQPSASHTDPVDEEIKEINKLLAECINRPSVSAFEKIETCLLNLKTLYADNPKARRTLADVYPQVNQLKDKMQKEEEAKERKREIAGNVSRVGDFFHEHPEAKGLAILGGLFFFGIIIFGIATCSRSCSESRYADDPYEESSVFSSSDDDNDDMEDAEDEVQRAMREAQEEVERSMREAQEEVERSMREAEEEIASGSSSYSGGSSSYSSSSDDYDESDEDDNYSESRDDDDDDMYSDDQNRRLKAKGKAAYQKAKEKTKEKIEEIKESERYQKAKEKAQEVKEKAKEKVEGWLDDFLSR